MSILLRVILMVRIFRPKTKTFTLGLEKLKNLARIAKRCVENSNYITGYT